jgi:hypothetical protein
MPSGLVSSFSAGGILAPGPGLVNSQHPLNKQRIGWWRSLPGLHGGNVYHDLTGRYPGTFNFADSSAGRATIAPPSGFGSVKGLSTSVNVIDFATNFGISDGRNMTYSVWAYFDSTSMRGPFIKLGNSTNGWGVGCGNSTFDDNGSNIIVLYEFVRWIGTGHSFTTGWHNIAFTINGSGNPTVYYDGRQVFTDAGAGNNSPSNECGFLGYYNGNGSRRFSGWCDDHQLWSRVLSPGEIQTLYTESRLGYPHMLNHRSPIIALSNMDLNSGVFNQDIAPFGIVSAETFGSHLVTRTILVDSWNNVNYFGNAVLLSGQFIEPESIDSEEAFGEPEIITGIANIFPTGIASGEAFGATQIGNGITLFPSGFSNTVFGNARIIREIRVTSVDPGEVGTPSILTSTVSISPSGIDSAAEFGTAEVLPGEVFINPPAIISASVVSSLNRIIVTIHPAGFESLEFGTPEVFFGAAEYAIGGGVVSGNAYVGRFFTKTTSGGSVGGGVAINNRLITPVISGGVVISGVTSSKMVFVTLISGGARVVALLAQTTHG